MGHVIVNVEVIGTSSRFRVDRVLIDTCASFTVLPLEIVEKIGGLKLPVKPVDLELGDGRKVRAELYAIGIAFRGREGGTLAVCFKEAKPVIGVRTLRRPGVET
ncbi:MAG: hypothetical protein QXP27_03380 [Candidatus Methanomethyliaceae archaeon]